MANGGILLLLLGDVLTSNVVISKASPRPFLGKRWWWTTSPSSWPWSLTFSLVFWWCTTLPSVPVLIWAASHVNLHLHIFYLLFRIYLFCIFLFQNYLFCIYLFRIYLFCTYLAAPLLYTTSRPFNGCIGLKVWLCQITIISKSMMQTKVIDYDCWKGKVFVLKLSTSWIPCSSLSSRYSAIWSRNSEVTNIPRVKKVSNQIGRPALQRGR